MRRSDQYGVAVGGGDERDAPEDEDAEESNPGAGQFIVRP
jgi:hypothetical protein